MGVALRRPFYGVAALFVVVTSAWVAARAGTLWDYPVDAGPVIDALAHLHLHALPVNRIPLMGPLSILLRAPFAALGQAAGGGGSEHAYLSDYRFGVFPCMISAGIFGMVLAHIAERDGRGLAVRGAIVVVAILNPVSLRAIHFGHPEEVLGAVLLAGSAVAAVMHRPTLSVTLLGLAVLNKQWAILGVPAVVVILLRTSSWAELRRPVLAMVALALILIAPLVAINGSAIARATRSLADLRNGYVFPASVWYPFGTELGPSQFVQISRGLRGMPDWLGLTARPLIVAVAVAVPLALHRRVGEDVLKRGLPLLALVMLLRCALDPADNGYYHVPFLLALLAADALTGRLYATLAACVLLQAPTTFHPSASALHIFYVAWALPFAVYLAARTSGVDWMAAIRTRAARGPAAAP